MWGSLLLLACHLLEVSFLLGEASPRQLENGGEQSQTWVRPVRPSKKKLFVLWILGVGDSCRWEASESLSAMDLVLEGTLVVVVVRGDQRETAHFEVSPIYPWLWNMG